MTDTRPGYRVTINGFVALDPADPASLHLAASRIGYLQQPRATGTTADQVAGAYMELEGRVVAVEPAGVLKQKKKRAPKVAPALGTTAAAGEP